MGIGERIRERATETLTEWTGLSVADSDELTDLRSMREELVPFLDGVEDLGLLVMDYVTGRPQEVQAWHRRRLSQQSRLALMHDPLAGAEANLRANFAFGKGIGQPQAVDPDVQEIIDQAWNDPINKRKLCSFEAQRHRSNELITTANLYCTVVEKNGKVRIAFVDPDLVSDIVTDPDDDEMPLWYVVRKRRFEWDFEANRWKPLVGYQMENGVEKVWYIQHYSNVEDVEEWAQETGEEVPRRPPTSNVIPGKLEHFPINRVGRTQFGIPPWARTLRFYCHDDRTEALTTEGWMGLPEIKQRWAQGSMPRVAGYDGERMVFEQPLDLNVTPFDGEMMAFKTARGFDMLVTPNHRMLDVRGGHIEAEQLLGVGVERRPFSPVGAQIGGRERVEDFVLPAVRARKVYDTPRLRRLRQRQEGMRARVAAGERQVDVARDEGVTREYVHEIVKGLRRSHGPMLPERRLPMDTWLAWLGWWISEGDPRMVITQKIDGDRIGDIRAACEAMVLAGIEGSERVKGGYYHWRPRNPKQFKAWLLEHCGIGSSAKHLPSFAFGLCADQARILLRALMGGDGTPTDWEADGWGRYYTASEQLAQDVQRLAILCGYRATVSESDNPQRCRWNVNISATVERRLPQPVPTPYRGDVWCFTMPSDNLVTRRNGVIAISGNTAMNQLTESQVQMRQGAASIIAQRIRRVAPRDIMKTASNVVAQTGELAAAAFNRRRTGGPPASAGEGTEPQAGQPPGPAASWWRGSEADRLEAVNLRSGAGEAMQDAQIVRAPIAAASQFGQHYLGDASATTLAGGTTLELPTLMEVSSWQQTFENILCFFTDSVIDAAVRAGRLGGMVAEDDGDYEKPLKELRLSEDKAEMESRTGKDLSYSFQMPYPGRRNLPDVTTAVTAVVMAYDPAGQNVELRRKLLDFLFRHGFMSDDPAREVDEVMPDDGSMLAPTPEPEPGKEEPGGGGEGEEEEPASTGTSSTGREASDGPQYKGQKTRSRPPGNEMGGGTRTKEALAAAGVEPGPETSKLLREGVKNGIEGLEELTAALQSDAQGAFAALGADATAPLPGVGNGAATATNGNGSH